MPIMPRNYVSPEEQASRRRVAEIQQETAQIKMQNNLAIGAAAMQSANSKQALDALVLLDPVAPEEAEVQLGTGAVALGRKRAQFKQAPGGSSIRI